MGLHLVTGHKGEAHITAEDTGALNAAILGNVDAILNIGEKFKASAITANTVRIYDGELIMQGRHVRIARDTYVDVPIENGTQDMNRNDLIVVRYTKDTLGYETAEFAVLKGAETAGTATDPTPTTGDLLSEACLLHEMPLYRVKLTGISVAEVELLADTIETIAEFRGESLSVSRGGTGKKTHTSNSVVVGNGTDAVKNIASANGALYATGTNEEPKFGVLPIAQGGTGATGEAGVLRNLGIDVSVAKINYLANVTGDVQGQLNGKVSMTRIWTNEDPTSAFDSQTLFDEAVYNEYLLLLIKHLTIAGSGGAQYRLEKFDIVSKYNTPTTNGTPYLTAVIDKYSAYRNVIFRSSGIYFSAGALFTSGTYARDDNACIPVEIYGIKLG